MSAEAHEDMSAKAIRVPVPPRAHPIDHSSRKVAMSPVQLVDLVG
jgi:hypothetical protein